MIRLNQGSAVDYAYFSCFAAAAGLRAGVSFDIDVPVRDDRVMLPGLGWVRVGDCRSSMIRLDHDGERLRVGEDLALPASECTSDDGSQRRPLAWHGTPLVHALRPRSAPSRPPGRRML